MTDTYTGNVTVGGPAETRELPGARLTKLAVDEQMANNVYIIECTATGDQLIVDAAADAARIAEHIDAGRVRAIVTTHQHWDHHRALAAVVEQTGAPVLAGEPDAAAITEQTGVAVAQTLADGDVITVGQVSLEGVRLTGHTPGSVALALRTPDATHTVHLLTGDSLFPGGPGKTSTADDFASLMDDLETKVFGVFPDDTWVYPGHGDDTTLGAERPHVAEWRTRGW